MKEEKIKFIEKIEFIRKMEKECGFARFKVSRKSDKEEIDAVLSFLHNIFIEIHDHHKPELDELFEEEDL